MGNLTDHFAGGGGSNILEELQFFADGRTVTTAKGDITAPNVTAVQKIASASMTTLTNCSFDYQPPDGATNVLIEASFCGRYNNDYSTYYRQLPVMWGRFDGTVVAGSKYSNYMHAGGSYVYIHFYPTLRISMQITGTNDIANGKVATWDTAKTISFIAASYDTGQHSYKLHNSHYGSTTAANNGNYTNIDQPPFYKVIAYK